MTHGKDGFYRWPHWDEMPGGWLEGQGITDFSAEEMACNGSGELLVHLPSLKKLQAVRTRLGVPMIIVSAYRSPSHNRRVGGASRSYHMRAKAYDVKCLNINPGELHRIAVEEGFRGFGWYGDDNFLHMDTGPKRYFEDPIPDQPRFTDERNQGRERVQNRAGRLGGAQAAIGACSAATYALTDTTETVQLALLGATAAIIVLGLILMRKPLARFIRRKTR